MAKLKLPKPLILSLIIRRLPRPVEAVWLYVRSSLVRAVLFECFEASAMPKGYELVSTVGESGLASGSVSHKENVTLSRINTGVGIFSEAMPMIRNKRGAANSPELGCFLFWDIPNFQKVQQKEISTSVPKRSLCP